MPFTSGNDFNVLQATDSANVGAGAGNDTYVITPSSMTAGQTINVTDAQGVNTIWLIGGVKIASSTIAANAIQLKLDNGATINLFGADTFSYKLGGNPLLDPNGGVSQAFTVFATQTLGAAGIPSGSATVFGSTGVSVNDNGTVGTPTPPPVEAKTMILTTAVDAGTVFTGTAQADTFISGDSGDFSNKTLTAGDALVGGAGVDVLKVLTSVGQNYSGFTSAGIEVLEATADTFAQTFDLSGTTDLTTLRSNNSSAATTFSQVTSLANVELVNLTATAGVSPNVTVAYQAPVVAGTADSVGLMLNNTNGGVVTLGSVTNATAGIETVNLQSTGAASVIGSLNTQMTTLNFSGSQNVQVTGVLAGTVRTIDASTATGGLTVNTNTASPLAFTGGAGNDQVAFAAGTLTIADTVNGGAGTADRIIANQADLTAAATRISNTEIIRVQNTLTGVQGADNAANLKADAFVGATSFELAAGYNNARIDNLSAAQNRVDILNDATATTFTPAGQVLTVGSNLGTLQLEDAGSSATSDTFTIGLGQNRVAALGIPLANANAVVGFVSGSVETVNIVSNGAATNATVFGSTAANSLNLSQGTANINTVNISGVEDLALTTAASNIGTINASTATGALNLAGVTFAATGGATVTTGSGNDVVSGSAGNDTLNMGAGSDTVNGTAGRDTITLGAGADTVNYTALIQSNATNTDTITDFESGVDTINVGGLGATRYVGTQATFALAQGALPAATITGAAAVFQADTNTLWVDIDRNGTLDANDLRVVLSGVSNLAASSVGIQTGNDITLTAANAIANGNAANTANSVSTPSINTPPNVPATTTAFDDTINTTVANLNGSTINGLAGNDTLVITDQVAAALLLGTPAAGGTLNSIENVVLQAGSTANVTIFNGAGVTTTAGAAAIVTLGTGGQTFNGSAGNDQVATAAAPGNDTINGNAGNDQITVQGLANVTVNAGAGNDSVAMAALGVTPLTSVDVLNGGDGTDTLFIIGNSAAPTDLNNVTNFETIVIFGNNVASTYTTVDSLVAAGATLGVGAAGAGAAVTFNGAAETNGAFSFIGSAFVDTFTGGAGADFIFGGGGNDVLVGGAGADTFAFSATGAANGNDSITGFTATDRLDFTAFEATANAPTVATEAAGILAAAEGSVFVISDINGSSDSAAGVAALFAPAGIAADDMVVIIQNGVTGNSNIYYVDNGVAGSAVAAGEVSLVGTLISFNGAVTDAMIV